MTLKRSERLAGEALRMCVPKQMPALEIRTVGGPWEARIDSAADLILSWEPKSALT